MTKDDALITLFDAPHDDKKSKVNPALTRAQVTDLVIKGILSLDAGEIPHIFEKRVWQARRDQVDPRF